MNSTIVSQCPGVTGLEAWYYKFSLLLIGGEDMDRRAQFTTAMFLASVVSNSL